MDLFYSFEKELPRESVLALYETLEWSSAKKPDRLLQALAGSDSVVSTWDGERLVGLGNAISDGSLVVYYSHLLVLPEYQGKGVGRGIVERLAKRYQGFHQHSLIADREAVGFYQNLGFRKAGECVAMWIYDGDDHG